MFFAYLVGTATQVTANQSPVAVALPEVQTVYAKTEAWFSANDSYDPDGSITSYFWDFQDGTYSSEPYTTHLYDLPGNYTVTLTVTDDLGATDQDTVNITIIESPPGNTTVRIQYLDTDKEECEKLESINATVIIERDYGDEPQVWYGTLIFEVFNVTMVRVHYDEREVILPVISPSGVTLIEFNLSQAGIHTVRASLYDNNGLSIHIKEISVNITQDPQNQMPVAKAICESQKIKVGEDVLFYGDSSYDPDGVITSYYWDFGDGNSSTKVNPSHVYESSGIYTVTLTVSDNDLAKITDTVSLEVVLPEGIKGGPLDSWGDYLVAVAFMGAISLLTITYGTEAGRYRFLGFFIPLYMKMKKEDILDHFTRGKIYGYIVANPGDHYNSIKKALKLSDGSFAYHIHILEKEGIIKSSRDGTHRRFYIPGMRVPENGGNLKKSQLLIIDSIKENPGISQKDIASILGVSSPTVNYHLKELLGLGIIKGERAGMRMRYYVNSEKGGDEMEVIPGGKLKKAQKKKFIDLG